MKENQKRKLEGKGKDGKIVKEIVEAIMTDGSITREEIEKAGNYISELVKEGILEERE